MELSSTDNSLDKNDGLLISAEKLAQMLDISVRSLWRLRAGGKIPAPVRLGGSVRWRTHEVQVWIDSGCPEQSKPNSLVRE
jgi:predicted DNA-binding transcriptional regulator AlpA